MTTSDVTDADPVNARIAELIEEIGVPDILVNNAGSQRRGTFTELARQTISPYGAAKGGIQMLTQSMAADLARFNVQVNAVSPGYFRTELNTALIADPAFNAWVEARTPAGRWGEVSELEGTLLFLCSPGADFVTGQNIFVDGGMTTSV